MELRCINAKATQLEPSGPGKALPASFYYATFQKVDLSNIELHKLPATSTLSAFHPSFRMIDDTNGCTERRLSNIMESLRALSLSELLPQAWFDNKYSIDERECLERCIETCVRISESINEHKGAGDRTAASLAEYHEKLATTISELKEFLKAVDSQNVAAGLSDPMQSVQVNDPIMRRPEQAHQQDWGSEDVNVNRFENICVAEDGIQIISSTTGDLIQAKNINVGVRSVQCLGQLSDSSIQRVSGAVTQPR